jgi:hypothetical protein
MQPSHEHNPPTIDTLIATYRAEGWHISLMTKWDGQWEAVLHKPAPLGYTTKSGAFYAHGRDYATDPISALTLAHVHAELDFAITYPIPTPEPLTNLLESAGLKTKPSSLPTITWRL